MFMSTYLVPAICTQCGARIEVDDSKEAGICPCCNTAFITKKAINNYYSTTNNFYTTNNIINTNSVNIHTETIVHLWNKFQTVIKDPNGGSIAWKIYNKMQQDYSSDYRSYYAGLLYYCRFRSQYGISPYCDECHSENVSRCYICNHYSCFTDSSSYYDALQLYKDAKALAPSTASWEIDNVWNQFMQNYTSSKQKAIAERKKTALAEIEYHQESDASYREHKNREALLKVISIMVYIILGICIVVFFSIGISILYFLIGYFVVRIIWDKAWDWTF